MTIGIYRISNKNTGECLYVGQSANIEQRWLNHKKEIRTLRHRQKGLIDLYETYGMEVFEFAILENTTKERLNLKELFYFEKLKPQFYGQIPSNKNSYHQSIDTRNKISDTLKAKAKAHEERQKAKFLSISEDIRKYASDIDKTKKDCCVDFQVSYRALENILRYYNIEWQRSLTKKIDVTRTRKSHASIRKCDFCNTVVIIDTRAQYERIRKGSGLCCSKECYYEQSSIKKGLPREAEIEFLYWNEQRSLREIAKIYNTSNPVILARMKHYNIPRREKNESRL